MKPYIFLDRDGTINKEKNYLYRIEDFEFEEGAIEGMYSLQEKGYGLVVITNQSGIARGYYTQKEADLLHQFMKETLAEKGIFLAGVYVCPHTLEDRCSCRKPKLELYQRAIRDCEIEVAYSFLVGDRLRDILPAKELGCHYGFLLSGHGKEEDYSILSKENVFLNLEEFSRSVPNASK